MWGNVTVG